MPTNLPPKPKYTPADILTYVIVGAICLLLLAFSPILGLFALLLLYTGGAPTINWISKQISRLIPR